MSAVLRTIVLAAAMAAVPLTSAHGKAPGADDPSTLMTERINEIRADHGLRALKQAPRLVRTARGYAGHLMRANRLAHGSSYADAGFARAGEILALSRGRSLAPRLPMRLWMNSAGHRALILDRSFRYVGAAPASGRFGGHTSTIWVAHFGAH